MFQVTSKDAIISAFRVPVPLVTEDPDAGDLVSICVNRAYLPYMAGALKMLLLPHTWKTSDPDALWLMQSRVANLISILANPDPCFTPPTPPPPTPPPPFHYVFIEDDMPQFRQEGCTLQVQCADGTWDTIYDPANCIADRTAQNSAGGDVTAGSTVQTDLTVIAGAMYKLQYAVHPGQCVTVSNARGGWSYDQGVNWRCPSGDIYSLGECGSAGSTDAGSFIPSLPLGRLIAKIGAAYFDAYNTDIVIPDGPDPTEVFFLMNDTDLSFNAGSVAFDVSIGDCPVSGDHTWSKFWKFDVDQTADFTFSFSTEGSPPTPLNYSATGVGGPGVYSILASATYTGDATTHITSVEMIVNVINADGRNHCDVNWNDLTGGHSHGEHIADPDPTGRYKKVFAIPAEAFTASPNNFRVQVYADNAVAYPTSPYDFRLESVKLTGIGTEPTW